MNLKVHENMLIIRKGNKSRNRVIPYIITRVAENQSEALFLPI